MLVVVESPYAGEVDENVAYARRAMADCLARGEAPIASHLLYTQPGILDDTKPDERKLGIAAGLRWAERADMTVFYVDRGWSKGMLAARAWCDAHGRRYQFRYLDQPPRPKLPGKTLAESLGIEVDPKAPGGRPMNSYSPNTDRRSTRGHAAHAEAEYDGWGR